MSELICEKYHMLLVLNRFGIDMGFSDSTIGEVCEKYNIDVDTFLSVVNLLISEDDKYVETEKISLKDVISYLKNSHVYFSEYKLPEIREKLMNALTDNNAVSLAVINYYDEYIAEVRKHMQYEEEGIFSYVEKYLAGDESEFNLASFSEHHHSVESKLTELKNIIIRYYHTKSTHSLSSALFDIFTCEKDLTSHSDIEDYILIPTLKAKLAK
ncbi:MAG: hemerythrin domain-containing protein [Rikenellaceae bacterium]